jgi:SAM-dependent methyltransferase
MKTNSRTPVEDQYIKARAVEIGPSRIERILKSAGSSILDIGCGDGGYVGALLQHGYESYGLDLAPEPYGANISNYLIKGDASHLPFKDQSFDTVLLINVLEHVDDFVALSEAHRICRKNVIFSVPREEEEELRYYNITYHPYVDATHLRYYTMERIRTTFSKAGFKINQSCFDGPINPLGLFLRTLHLPRRFCIQVGTIINRVPGIKKYNINIEGVATKEEISPDRLKIS